MNRRAFLKMLVFAPIAGLLARVKMLEVDGKTTAYLRYRELMDKLIDEQKGKAKAVKPKKQIGCTFTIVNDNAGRPAAYRIEEIDPDKIKWIEPG